VAQTEILRCPKTGQPLHFDEAASVLRGEQPEVNYPVIDGIADFCSGVQDRVSASYDRAAARYDPCITGSTLSTKIVGRIIWGRAGDRDPMDKVLSLLPNRFDGVLLDVPVGTGVFTAPVYRRYPQATIVAVDCSLNMLRRAKTRFQEQGVNNIHLLKADAANLPVGDGTVDMLVCMNGWHAFADKPGTIAELRRVLRKGGVLIACGYVRGGRRVSDGFVNCFGVRKGFFTSPFFTFDDLDRRFEGLAITNKGRDTSIAWLEAIKKRS
jgi:SAM-dependent methyltransferase